MDKQLMLGNTAAARGLYECGVEIVSSYPGTPSTEITEEAAKYKEIYCEWAPNEKVALESVYGAALAGKRSFCAMKHVGLNVAADPLYTASYAGVNAGLVIGVADDPGIHSSQNEQDSRNHAIASKIPMVEPSDSQEAIDFMKMAYELSEKYDTPVLYKLCTRISHSQSVVQVTERKNVPIKPYKKDIQKNVMTPANAIRKHPIVEKRMQEIADSQDALNFNKIELAESREVGIITSSTSYEYVKEIFGDRVCVLKIGLVNPLPKNMIVDFASKVKKIVVVEELDPIMENFCRTLNLPVNIYGKDILPICNEFNQNILRDKLSCILELKDLMTPLPVYKKLEETIPVRPPIMCAGCPHRGIFYVLSKLKLNVMGDIGCYTLGAAAPLFAMDMNLCMGASVSALHGWNKALKEQGEKNSVAVIGDSTFVHSGITALASIAYNQSNSTVIILDNSITGMTGHQQNPTTGKNLYGEPAGKIDLEKLVLSMGITNLRVVDPYNLAECETVVKEELAKDGASVIISRRPCVLLKEVKLKSPLKVDASKCKSCKMCMKIGCPALSIKNGKAHIDFTLCTGCEVCKQMCKFDCFEITT